MGANAGRVAAARALIAVEEGEHVEDALARLAPGGGDRSLAWFLALGVLRRRSEVDGALRPFLRQPLTSLDPEVRAALRVGTFEVLFARTAAHAAVHQGVELAKALGAARARGLVNAVLRKVRPADDLSRAESLDHPAWIVARWDARYGEEATTAWCRRNNEPAALFLVGEAEGEPVRLKGELLPGVVRVGGGDVTRMEGFAEGRFWVQDPASVAVADLVGEAREVLDACAAPGGKSFRLASRGARVVAVDLDPVRLELVEQSAGRLGLDLDLRIHDWLEGPLSEERFDAVLVDAPCTALGLLRRHPDIRWRRQLVDVLAAPRRQQVILENAAVHVAPGGVLVYAVCSPEPEEGRGVVEAFLAEHADFALETTLQTAPPEGDEDAFQAFRMRRAA